ncbi:MAG: hypothetical protein WC107_00110 [Patescibacteria group bacterium]
MKIFFQKLLFAVISVVIILNPFLLSWAQAADIPSTEIDSLDSSDYIAQNRPDLIRLNSITIQQNFTFTLPETNNSEVCKKFGQSEAYQQLAELISYYTNPDSLLSVDDIFGPSSDARLVLAKKDIESLKKLKCMSDIMPDFNNDLFNLFAILPADNRNKIYDQVNTEKTKESPRYLDEFQYLTWLQNGTGITATETISNHQQFRDLVSLAEKNFGDKKLKGLWEEEAARIKATGKTNLANFNTLSCITGIDSNTLQGKLLSDNNKEYVADLISDAISAPTIDIRVLKTLIYLITPKDQGGGGHWRIKANRILQNDTDSNESDVIREQLNGSITNSNVVCSLDESAAECGAKANSFTIEDKDGQEYDAYYEDLKNAEILEDSDPALKNSRNISAHYNGQAVDITEIDDVRCTVLKKRRIGHDFKEPQAAQPIKLAWQTTDGYRRSNTNTGTDLMETMRQMASQSALDLLSAMNPQFSSYDGDLSSAGLDDIVSLLGQSLFANIINSPTNSIHGSDVEDTLKNLGGVYLADYLGLPREILTDTDITDLTALKYVIGRSAIEKRLGLPFGSLDNDFQAGKEVKNNLFGLLENIGQRKVEAEMNLRAGDLDNLNDGTMFATLVGAKIIEAKLNLPKESWPTDATSFNDLDDSLNSVRTQIFRNNAGYIDNLLHIQPGTTSLFTNGHNPNDHAKPFTAAEYANIVGESRKHDTSFGLKYFAMTNSAYQLPDGTWEQAISGSRSAYQTIGIYTLARRLGDDSTHLDSTKFLNEGETIDKIFAIENGQEVEYNPGDLGYLTFREWLRGNLAKVTAKDACQRPAEQINITIHTDAGNIEISDEIEKKRQQSICALSQTVNFRIQYKTQDSSEAQSKDYSQDFNIPKTKAKTAGLEDFDLFLMMGYANANAENVFERIGSKLLYYGLANKLLDDEDKTKIDLLNLDPELSTNNKELGFYLARVLKVYELQSKINSEWEALKSDDVEIREISDKVEKTMSSLRDLLKNDSDLSKLQGIINSASVIATDLADLQKNLLALKQVYEMKKTSEYDEKAARVNILITDVNELIRAISEIMAGKEIPSDLLTINQIKPGLDSTQNTDSGDGRRKSKKLTTFQIAKIIFNFIAGKIGVSDLFVTLGANTAEAKLGLPSNSLIYFVENFEKRGVTGQDAFMQAIGQARIEEHYNMPFFYFQGASISKTPPDFKKDFEALMRWAGPEILSAYFGDTVKLSKFDEFFKRLSQTRERLTVDYFRKLKKDNPDQFKKFVDAATTRWKQDFQSKLKDQNGLLTKENDLDDIVENISNRKFGDNIRTPENDLLFRMGLPMGSYEALKSGNSGIWSEANSTAEKADKNFDVLKGSTKSLFTEEKTLTSASLTNKQKNLIEASILKISKNALEKYIQMLNGELLPSEADEYGSDRLVDYINANPYADDNKESSCKVIYTQKEGFSVNETTLQNNSFCYYDKEGRHCFESREEAQNYANNHKEQQIISILYEISYGLSRAFPGWDFEIFHSNLENFVNDPSMQYAFGEANTSNIVINEIYRSTGLPITLLEKLFVRNHLKNSVANYKQLVGEKEAAKIFTYKLFDNLPFSVDPDLFDAGDMFDLLNGDYSSAGRIASGYLDQEMELKTGTTYLIYTALTTDARDCAFAQAGGTFLGGLFGLDYVPIKGKTIDSFISNIGQAKIEETLGIPRGTFHGDDIEEIIRNVKPINFAAAFKIPFLWALKDEGKMSRIMGEQYALIKNSDISYQLLRLQKYVQGTPMLSNDAFDALSELQNELTINITDALTILPSTTDSNDITQNARVSAYIRFIAQLDNTFSLKAGGTYQLLYGKITPSEYIEEAGNSLIKNRILDVSVDRLCGIFDLSVEQEEGAKKTVTALRAIFTAPTFSISGESSNPDYKNYALLFDGLTNLFKYKLADKLSIPQTTILSIIENPDTAYSTMMGVIAAKLDEQADLNSTSQASFSGIYKALLPTDVKSADDQCRATYADEQLRLALIKSGAEKEISKTVVGSDEYENAVADRDDAVLQINALNAQETECKITARRSIAQKQDIDKGTIPKNEVLADRARLWLQNAAIEQLHKKIANLTIGGVFIGVDVPTADLKDLFGRDSNRAISVITMALTSNYAIKKIDGVDTKTPIPAEFFITYEMIRNSIYGLSTKSAQKLAAYKDATGNSANPEVTEYAPGAPECAKTGGNDFAKGIDCLGQVDAFKSPVESVQATVERQYDYTPEKYEQAKVDLQTQINRENTSIKNSCTDRYEQQHKINSCIQDEQAIRVEPLERKLNTLNDPSRANAADVQDVNGSAKNRAIEILEYRALDIGLWKLDTNIYPGFAEAIIKGNGEIKTAAIVKYVKRGVTNGHLFGVKFDAVKNVQEWGDILVYASSMIQGNNMAALETLIKVNNGQSFQYFANYMAKGFEKIFRFSITPDMAKGILVGLSTNDWGINSFSFEGIQGNANQTIGGASVPTLGQAIVNWGVGRVFNWADRALGVSEGTSFRLAKSGIDAYKANQALRSAQKSLQTATENVQEAQRLYDEAVNAGMAGQVQRFQTNLENAQAAETVEQIKVDNAKALRAAAFQIIVQMTIDYLVEKYLGETISGWEEDLNLVPGSLMVLVSTAAYASIAIAAHAIAGAWIIPMVDPVTIAITLLTFLAINLFSTYRVEYWCSVDGYYPYKDSSPPSSFWDKLSGRSSGNQNINLSGDPLSLLDTPVNNFTIPSSAMQKNDISGIGVFGGNAAHSSALNKTLEKKKILAAQYKARRLIGDVLSIQYDSKYNDSTGEALIPTQIMTGRSEDVTFWNDMVSTNICQQRLGKDALAVNGICLGFDSEGKAKTKEGLWANTQTTVWTHVGF